ncbi:hypothetical protein OG895_43380 [Streptomyces sp. NBC_00201]|nr:MULTISPECIES: hypothetical protein [unclassified Streptomyces]MCX5063739.1 hypothetical protein [Streptomyces sp. NBC_00452]MCX5251894.1 hypothetical protein [Streptomyces sp. NBC_00201]
MPRILAVALLAAAPLTVAVPAFADGPNGLGDITAGMVPEAAIAGSAGQAKPNVPFGVAKFAQDRAGEVFAKAQGKLKAVVNS